MKKKVAILVILLVLVAVAAYKYTYKPHRDIAAEEGSFTVTADKIFSEFQADENSANAKYLDKTIDVSGTISGIDAATKSIVINDKLFATFKDDLPKTLQLKAKIAIKGRFVGYDALVEELKMDQCVILE